MAIAELIIQGVDNASGVISGIGGPLLGIGAMAGGAVVAGFAAAGAASLSFAGEANQAQRDIQAQLGLTGAEAERLGGIAETVFANNWYGSISEAMNATALIQQQLGDLGDEGLAQVSAGVAAISDTFGAEAPAIVDAVKAIRDNFPGTTEAQALDMITVGFQNGLDANGDFLDSIREYGTQFGEGGASAQQFFGILESGMGTGVLGTDKAGDLFKEFVVRIQDGSTLTRESLTALGLDADTILTGLADNTLQPIDAFNQVTSALARTDNEALAMQAGVGLLGTQLEDLGLSAVNAIDPLSDTFADASGAVDGLNVKYGSLGSLVEGFGRQALVATKPLADGLLELGNQAMPFVVAGMTGLIDGLTQIVSAVQPVIASFTQQAAASDIVGSAVSILSGMWTSLSATVQAIAAAMAPYIQAIFGQIATFLQNHGAEIQAFLTSAWQQVSTIVTTAAQLVAAIVIPIFTGLASFIGAHGAEIQALLTGAWDVISGVIGAALTLIQGVVQTALQIVQGDFSGAWETIQATTSALWEQLSSAFDGGFAMLQSIVTLAVNGIASLFGGLPRMVVGVGAAVVEMIRSGFESAWNGFLSAAKAKLQEFRDMLPFSEPRDSQSPLFGLGKSGAAIVEMVQSGITSAPPLSIAPAVVAGPGGAFTGEVAGLLGRGNASTPTARTPNAPGVFGVGGADPRGGGSQQTVVFERGAVTISGLGDTAIKKAATAGLEDALSAAGLQTRSRKLGG